MPINFPKRGEGGFLDNLRIQALSLSPENFITTTNTNDIRNFVTRIGTLTNKTIRKGSLSIEKDDIKFSLLKKNNNCPGD